MSVGENATLSIAADGLSNTPCYVQGVKVNGEAWNQCWVSHDDLVGNGGKWWWSD